jgi:DNA-binding NtrC family response regulator
MKKKNDKKSGLILVVEDDIGCNESFTISLEDKGYSVLSYYNGNKLMNDLSEGEVSYDLAFVDNELPGMGGLDICNKLKIRYPDRPIILQSGYSNSPPKFQFDGFWSKCSGRQSLLNLIGTLIKR